MFIIGVDVSKRKLSVALYLDVQRERFRTKVLANQPGVGQELLDWAWRQARCAPEQLHVVLEASGSYHETLALELYRAGASVSVVNPARVREFANGLSFKSKTDQRDSVVLARFGQLTHPQPWTPPPEEALELQSLIRRLEAIETDIARTSNRLEAARYATTAAPVLASLREQLAFLNEQHRALRKSIDDHIDTHPKLKSDQQLLLTIPAVGEKTAQRMVALFHTHRFRNAAQSASYLGLDVIEHQSGTSVHKRPRLSKQGPARIRAALYMPAIVACHHNPDVAALYRRLRARAKPPKLAIGAAMRKLVHICFGVWKSQTPYRPLSA